MRSEPDETDPWSFEGPEIIKCKGYVLVKYKMKEDRKITKY